jgi:uncharacterized protein YuzB (UPF0349 family)
MKHQYANVLYVVVLTALLLPYNCFSQPFTSVSNPFPGLGRGAVAFADLDNDGDLDVVMSGQNTAYNPVAKVFMNVNGEFTEVVSSNLRGLYNCALSVADYDHDGLFDVIITGQGVSGNVTHLYRNTGSMQFQLADSTLYAAGANGDVAFGDYNNDGYADIVLSGNWASKLYRTNGDGTFTEVEAGLPALNSPSIAWGDYDNDGDMDLLMVGDDGSASAYVMTNNGGTFSRLVVDIEGAIAGTARWGDFDMDGYLDIMLTGKDNNLVAVSYIYRNNSLGSFTYANAGLVGTALGPADWIDYDNDSDLDVMLAGQNSTCGTSFTRLYNNDGIGGYTEVPAGLAFAERSASAWGDYDNDGDIDLLLIGVSGNAVRMLYRNDLITGTTFQPNTPPTVPVITDIYTWEDFVIFNWERSTDMQTPSLALTYNLRIGTSPGASDILSPNADLMSGVRYMPTQGNMAANTFAIVRSLQPGTYYYSLQAIDQSFAASPFTEEQSFVILPTSTNKIIDNSHTSIVYDGQNLHITTGFEGKMAISIYSMNGMRVYSNSLSETDGSYSATSVANTRSLIVPVSNLPGGIYIINIVTDSGIYSQKVKL